MELQTISRLKETDLSYLAGIIEGEGNIDSSWCTQYASKKKYPLLSKHLVVEIQITNTDPRMIKRVSEIYKKLGVHFYFTTSKHTTNKKWSIRILSRGKNTVKKILNSIYPYLSSKKDQADIMLEIIRYRESLGYHPYGFRSRNGNINPDWKPLDQNEILNNLVNKLRELKHDHPSASTTKRRANQILQIEGIDY